MRTGARLLRCNMVLTLKGWRSESPETHGRVLISFCRESQFST